MSKLSKKQKEIVDYINRQQKEGHPKGRIRTRMEIEGHTPEMLNCYFALADKELAREQSLKVFAMVVVGVLLLSGAMFGLQNTNLVGAVTTTSTGAISWSWSGLFGNGDYNCGDDYPADADNVMDLSDCVADEKDTKNNLFCYVNNTVTSGEISPNGSNDDWYSTNVEEDISSISSIDTADLLESSIIFPWTASYDNVDCFSWTHGTTRTEEWHQCNATESVDIEPPNLVFYYADVGDGSNVSYGGISTSLSLNSSYYLCYDELECVTQTTACDEDAGYYCVGRLDAESGSSWYPCDTSLDASYYRCCKGGCEGIEMECGEKIELPDGSETTFDECNSDGTSGCCSSSTDCVYDSECYSEDETIKYMSGTLGLGGTSVEGTMTEYSFVCSDAHWCPNGFEYDDRDNICQPTQAACYDASNSDYCNYIFGTDSIDDWEADTEGTSAGCIEPDIDSGGTIYNESCIHSGSYGGVDYYFLQDIMWY